MTDGLILKVRDLERRLIRRERMEIGRQPTYGGISAIGNVTPTAITTAGVAVQVTIFTTNDSSNNTTPDYTNDHITILEAGAYMIVSSITLESIAGAASQAEVTVQKNNGTAVVGALHIHRDLSGGGGEAGAMGLSGIATLAVADTIEVWIENQTNTQNYVVADITLSVLKVS